MKKKLLLLSIIVSQILVAQKVAPQNSTDAFHKGSQHFSAGYGAPNLVKYDLKRKLRTDQTFSNNSGVKNPNEYKTYSIKGKGPLFLKYEYAIMEHIGIGVVFGYVDVEKRIEQAYQAQSINSQTGQLTASHYTVVGSYSVSSLSVGARLNYHFRNKETIDPYLGFGVGFTRFKWEESSEVTSPAGVERGADKNTEPLQLYLGLTIGVRCYLTERLGLYAEVGVDKWALFQGGLVIKID